jgi:hypothetical protein
MNNTLMRLKLNPTTCQWVYGMAVTRKRGFG